MIIFSIFFPNLFDPSFLKNPNFQSNSKQINQTISSSTPFHAFSLRFFALSLSTTSPAKLVRPLVPGKIIISSSDNENNKESVVTVVCRLLAPSSQIESVLGKGGKIIEMIRHDNGAHVRVLHHVLPPCSSIGDELIQVCLLN